MKATNNTEHKKDLRMGLLITLMLLAALVGYAVGCRDTRLSARLVSVDEHGYEIAYQNDHVDAYAFDYLAEEV